MSVCLARPTLGRSGSLTGLSLLQPPGLRFPAAFTALPAGPPPLRRRCALLAVERLPRLYETACQPCQLIAGRFSRLGVSVSRLMPLRPPSYRLAAQRCPTAEDEPRRRRAPLPAWQALFDREDNALPMPASWRRAYFAMPASADDVQPLNRRF